LPKIDGEFEAITEGEELTRKENRAAWGCRDMDRAKRSPERVQESRGDDCIKLKTKGAMEKG
jgi:hypothetical protein